MREIVTSRLTWTIAAGVFLALTAWTALGLVLARWLGRRLG